MADNLIIGCVVDDTVVADMDPHLSRATFQLLASGRSGIVGERVDGVKDPSRNSAVKFAQRLER